MMAPTQRLDALLPMHVQAGDYELNYQYPVGAPTLIPAPGLERALDFRLGRASATPDSMSRTSEALPACAIHIHGFHLRELEVLLDELCGSVSGFDVFVTTNTTEKQEAIEALLRRHPIARDIGRSLVLLSVAPGRNVGALFLDAYDHLLDYDCALHLHTKRSVHTELSESWRQSLHQNLIGSPGLIREIRQGFQRDDRLGLLIPQTCQPMRQCLNWGSNFSIAQLIWQSLQSERQLSVDAPLVFPVGMMFWFRPRALRPMAELCRRIDPLPLEPLPLDGTSLHALERLVAHITELEGFRWRMICDQEPEPGCGSGDQHRQLSVLEPQTEAYLQACSMLADRSRSLTSELEYVSASLESAQARVLQLEQQLERQLTGPPSRWRTIRLLASRLSAWIRPRR